MKTYVILIQFLVVKQGYIIATILFELYFTLVFLMVFKEFYIRYGGTDKLLNIG